MKTTFNVRPPQNIKIGISQQPLYGFYLMKLEENAEEISSVALLSPACFLILSLNKLMVKQFLQPNSSI